MKKTKLTKTFIISLTLLTVILLSTTVDLAQSCRRQKILKAKVKWKPKKYTLGMPVPDLWIAEIETKKLRKHQQIDPASILLEGIYSPVSDPYPKKRRKLNVPFSGEDVLNLMLLKLGHFTPGNRYRIRLEITGNILGKCGKLIPFRGMGHIKLIIPE